MSFDLAEYTAEVDGVGTLRLLDAIRTCGLSNTIRLEYLLRLSKIWFISIEFSVSMGSFYQWSGWTGNLPLSIQQLQPCELNLESRCIDLTKQTQMDICQKKVSQKIWFKIWGGNILFVTSETVRIKWGCGSAVIMENQISELNFGFLFGNYVVFNIDFA